VPSSFFLPAVSNPKYAILFQACQVLVELSKAQRLKAREKHGPGRFFVVAGVHAGRHRFSNPRGMERHAMTLATLFERRPVHPCPHCGWLATLPGAQCRYCGRDLPRFSQGWFEEAPGLQVAVSREEEQLAEASMA
jgi:hypothetical protein